MLQILHNLLLENNHLAVDRTLLVTGSLPVPLVHHIHPAAEEEEAASTAADLVVAGIGVAVHTGLVEVHRIGSVGLADRQDDSS